MASDEGTLTVIRQALEDSDRVDDRRVDLTAEGEEVVLRGAVASNEEATVAAMVAAQHADAVRNELQVDPNLREDASDPEMVDAPDPGRHGRRGPRREPPPRSAGRAEPGADRVRAARVAATGPTHRGR